MKVDERPIAITLGLGILITWLISGYLGFIDEQELVAERWATCISSMGQNPDIITDSQIDQGITQCAEITGYVTKDEDYP